jgi:hypothetical protein
MRMLVAAMTTGDMAISALIGFGPVAVEPVAALRWAVAPPSISCAAQS